MGARCLQAEVGLVPQQPREVGIDCKGPLGEFPSAINVLPVVLEQIAQPAEGFDVVYMWYT